MDKDDMVFTGQGITNEILFSYPQKERKKKPSVIIGNSLQPDVASFYAQVNPAFINPEAILSAFYYSDLFDEDLL